MQSVLFGRAEVLLASLEVKLQPESSGTQARGPALPSRRSM